MMERGIDGLRRVRELKYIVCNVFRLDSERMMAFRNVRFFCSLLFFYVNMNLAKMCRDKESKQGQANPMF
jgi:hypothetical protein